MTSSFVHESINVSRKRMDVAALAYFSFTALSFLSLLAATTSHNTRAFSSSSAPPTRRNQLSGFLVKFRKCTCDPFKFFDIKVSCSRSNPGQPFYKRAGCGEFDWVYDDDMMKVNTDGDETEQGSNIAVEVSTLKEQVQAMADTVALVVKIGCGMLDVLALCVLFK